jgi:DNA-binding transcriptional LysR family regulator
VAPALSGFVASHPGIEVEVILTDRHADLVAERFDLAVRLGITPDSRLVEHRLAPHRFLTAASPAYLEARGTPDVPPDLAQHACLGYTMATTGQPRVWEFEQADQNWRHTPRGAPRSDSAPLLMDLAIGGHGIIQAPHYVLRDALERGLLRQILPDYRCLGLPLAIIYPQSRYLSAAKRAFIDFLKRIGGP